MTSKMKIVLLTIVFLCMCTQLHVNAQSSAVGSRENSSIQAIYRLDYRPDSTTTGIRSELMILRASNGISCFQSVAKYQTDTLLANSKNTDSQKKLEEMVKFLTTTGRTKFSYSIFKEPAKKIVYYDEEITNVSYRYKEGTPLFQWKIMPETKKIAGYTCQQAFTDFAGRRFEAWFTREVPISEGPYKFYGLPGLIIKIGDIRSLYVFELLSLKHAVQHPPVVPLITFTDKTKFNLAKKAYELSLLDRLEASGQVLTAEDKRSYFERLKSRNNALELR